MKLLLTGFEPFLDLSVNPTMPIVEALDGQQIGGYTVVGHILPVVFEEAKGTFRQLLAQLKPDLIVSLGVAVGRYHITPERMAINVASSTKPDNAGVMPVDAPVYEGGRDSYLSQLPITRIVTALQQAGYPARISNTAGTYVCNTIMYEGLRYAETNRICAGFIHIPANFELAIKHGNVPSWHQRDLHDAIRYALEEVVKARD